MTAESSSLEPTVAAHAVKAELGLVSDKLFVVFQVDNPPPAAVAQPAGSAGLVTPSKFCDHTVANWPSVTG